MPLMALTENSCVFLPETFDLCKCSLAAKGALVHARSTYTFQAYYEHNIYKMAQSQFYPLLNKFDAVYYWSQPQIRQKQYNYSLEYVSKSTDDFTEN